MIMQNILMKLAPQLTFPNCKNSAEFNYGLLDLIQITKTALRHFISCRAEIND